MAKSAIPPFDVLAAISQLLEASSLSIETLLSVDAGALLEQTSRDLARDLVDVPVEQRNALRVAAFAGYLAALGRGFQLGAMALEQWQSRVLDVAAAAHEAGELDSKSYGFILGLMKPDQNLVVSADERVH